MLILACSAAAEPFEYMIALTRQDVSMDWWYAVPQPFAPEINQISRVAKGEYFRIIPFFKNYGIDTNGNANITFDFELVRPDGSINESIKGCAGHDGKASVSELIPSHAVLNLCFDSEDPYGEYTINVTAYDHVSSLTNRQTVVIEQNKYSVYKMTEAVQEELFLTYAAVPSPSRALSSFLQTEHSFFTEENEPIWSAIWFYKTIFENNDYLIPHLLEGFPSASLKHQRDTILVLALMNKTDKLPKLSGELKAIQRVMESGRIPDPYDDIMTGKQIDMLWAEYFATGTIKPIRQLVTSLNLADYLGTLEKIKTGELDSDQLEVYRAGMLEATFQSALWSLRANCKQSPLLFHYCVGILNSEELEKTAQSCLGMLLQSVAEVTSAKSDSKKEGTP
ncbi:MAG: hypothetical protein V3V05_08105 [Pontiella sp.]